MPFARRARRVPGLAPRGGSRIRTGGELNSNGTAGSVIDGSGTLTLNAAGIPITVFDNSAGTDLLEGLLDKKAGQDDAAGLIESVYPGSGASVLERQGRGGEVKNIDEVYTRGAVQLVRLGGASPIGAGAMSGPPIRDARYSSAAARSLYTNVAGPTRDRPDGPAYRPRSPTIGAEGEPGPASVDQRPEPAEPTGPVE